MRCAAIREARNRTGEGQRSSETKMELRSSAAAASTGPPIKKCSAVLRNATGEPHDENKRVHFIRLEWSIGEKVPASGHQRNAKAVSSKGTKHSKSTHPPLIIDRRTPKRANLAAHLISQASSCSLLKPSNSLTRPSRRTLLQPPKMSDEERVTKPFKFVTGTQNSPPSWKFPRHKNGLICLC